MCWRSTEWTGRSRDERGGSLPGTVAGAVLVCAVIFLATADRLEVAIHLQAKRSVMFTSENIVVSNLSENIRNLVARPNHVNLCLAKCGILCRVQDKPHPWLQQSVAMHRPFIEWPVDKIFWSAFGNSFSGIFDVNVHSWTFPSIDDNYSPFGGWRIDQGLGRVPHPAVFRVRVFLAFPCELYPFVFFLLRKFRSNLCVFCRNTINGLDRIGKIC